MLGVCLVSFSFMLLGISQNITTVNVVFVMLFLLLLGSYFSSKYKNEVYVSKFKQYLPIQLSLIPFFIMALLFSVLQKTDWDSSVYHLTAIEEFIKSGGISFYLEREPLNFPMMHNLLYIPFLILGMQSGVACFNLIILLVGIYAIFSLSKLLFKIQYG